MSGCYPRKAPNLAARVLKGEAIIMNPADSSLFSLNETATAIWQAADGRKSLREIVENEVCPRFEIDADSALRDAEALVRDLAEQKVMILAEKPADE